MSHIPSNGLDGPRHTCTTKAEQHDPPGVVVGAAVVVGRGEVVTAASSSSGHQSHQRIGWHATFMHDSTITQ